MVKGLPMIGLLVGHWGAPPDEYIPYHSRTLHPLHMYQVKGYSYNTTVEGQPLADGHQLFQTWLDRGGCQGQRGEGRPVASAT